MYCVDIVVINSVQLIIVSHTDLFHEQSQIWEGRIISKHFVFYGIPTFIIKFITESPVNHIHR